MAKESNQVENPLLCGMGWFPDQPGGLNRYFVELYRALEASGADPRGIVVGPVAHRPAGVSVTAHARDRLISRLRHYVGSVRAALPTASLVDAHFALYAFLPVMRGLRGRPLVVHFHGPWAEEGAVQGESRLKVRAKRFVERSVYSRAREIVVLSHAFKRILVERYGIAPWRVNVVPPGVDLERFSPSARAEARERLGLPENAWLALTVRRLVPRMGVDVLLEAWSGLGDLDAILLIAGDGPIRARLEERASELGLEGSIRFMGRVDDDELVDYYRAADLTVVPSTTLEGFGLVVLESLACGTPALVTDVGGLPEVVAPLDPTLVVAPSDPVAIADRLRGAREGTTPLPGSERCRSYAETFSWPEVAARHREIYARATAPEVTRRTRVVYVDHCAKLSGGELALLRLLPALEEVDPHVILGEDGPLVEKLRRAGVSVEVLPMSRRAGGLERGKVAAGLGGLVPAVLSTVYAIRLARRLRRQRPDVVHTNSLKAALYGGVAGRLARTPVVWHLRDRIADDYLPSAAVRLVRAAARRLPSAVIANSEATLATLGELDRPNLVLPSPVDLEPAEASAARNGNLRVGIVGRLAPWKGQHVFLDAFAKAFPTNSASAVVVGAPLFGEEEYAESLRRQADELGLDGRVEFAGFRENVAAELAGIDVLVHASVIPEPFGQVVIEGMCAGVPVIAAGEGGPAEVIEDGVTGVLYPPGDTEALAAALRRLGADATLRAELGEAGRLRARDFSPEAIAPRLIGFYRELLAGKSA